MGKRVKWFHCHSITKVFSLFLCCLFLSSQYRFLFSSSFSITSNSNTATLPNCNSYCFLSILHRRKQRNLLGSRHTINSFKFGFLDDINDNRYSHRLFGRKRKSGSGSNNGNKKGKLVKQGSLESTVDNDMEDDAGYSADHQYQEERPARVMGTNIRRQIRFVKERKALEKEQFASSSNNLPKKFNAKNKNKNKDVFIDDHANINSVDHLYAMDKSRTILLIDGYNVIQSWRKTIKAKSAGALAQARQVLLEECYNLQVAQNYKIEIVYDSQKEIGAHTISSDGVDEVFPGKNESADSYIERKSKEFVNEGRKVVVATNDNMIKSISADYGAIQISTSKLIQEFYSAKKQVQLSSHKAYRSGEIKIDNNGQDYFNYD